jgi:hypothetical protein
MKKKPKLKLVEHDGHQQWGFMPFKTTHLVFKGRAKKHIGTICQTYRNTKENPTGTKQVWIYRLHSHLGTAIESFYSAEHLAHKIAEYEGATI